MHVSGFLIFLAIVVYWASCMGRQALKWVAILFVSACLLPVAIGGIWWASYAIPQALADYRRAHPSDAELVAQSLERVRMAEEAKASEAREQRWQRASRAVAAAHAHTVRTRLPLSGQQRVCVATFSALAGKYQERYAALAAHLTDEEIDRLAAACHPVPALSGGERLALELFGPTPVHAPESR
jgi:hypothetical protein